MKKEVTAVFDIGKTNKKFFLFDTQYRKVYKEYHRFEEIEDEDGYPAENLIELQNWIVKVFSRMIKMKAYKIKHLNFTAYGASFVHLDRYGKILTPLYSYSKPLPEAISDQFYSKYGSPLAIAVSTASLQEQMLNSGMQLYWIKYCKPHIYKRIKHSLHFPQYLSYLFTKIPLSEFTSIGCHTNLWDYTANDYHYWVYNEGIDRILPPVVSAKTSFSVNVNGRKIKTGVGIHDSSSALLSYMLSERKAFVLIATGTWSVSINPFENKLLSEKDIKKNCFSYMDINGKQLRANRFFMGGEYEKQVGELGEYYNKKYGYHRNVKFDRALYKKLAANNDTHFKLDKISVERKSVKTTDLKPFSTFEEAFHQFMIELVALQAKNTKMLNKGNAISHIYIDGGFTDNNVFVKLLPYYFKDYKIRIAKSPFGSALGAAMILCENKWKTAKLFLESQKTSNYGTKSKSNGRTIISRRI